MIIAHDNRFCNSIETGEKYKMGFPLDGKTNVQQIYPVGLPLSQSFLLRVSNNKTEMARRGFLPKGIFEFYYVDFFIFLDCWFQPQQDVAVQIHVYCSFLFHN